MTARDRFTVRLSVEVECRRVFRREGGSGFNYIIFGNHKGWKSEFLLFTLNLFFSMNTLPNVKSNIIIEKPMKFCIQDCPNTFNLMEF